MRQRTWASPCKYDDHSPCRRPLFGGVKLVPSNLTVTLTLSRTRNLTLLHVTTVSALKSTVSCLLVTDIGHAQQCQHGGGARGRHRAGSSTGARAACRCAASQCTAHRSARTTLAPALCLTLTRPHLYLVPSLILSWSLTLHPRVTRTRSVATSVICHQVDGLVTAVAIHREQEKTGTATAADSLYGYWS